MIGTKVVLEIPITYPDRTFPTGTEVVISNCDNPNRIMAIFSDGEERPVPMNAVSARQVVPDFNPHGLIEFIEDYLDRISHDFANLRNSPSPSEQMTATYLMGKRDAFEDILKRIAPVNNRPGKGAIFRK